MMNRIDFHSHIFPGADHGSLSVETSLGQLSLMKKAEIRQVVATPHFYPTKSSVRQFLELRDRCAQALKAVLTDEHPLIYPGG